MKILEIEIQTDNIIETEAFYKETFGLKLFNKSKDSISFIAGNSKLTFIKSENIKPKYHFAFNIPNNKLGDAINWAETRIKLIENDLENATDRPFDTSIIESISEIGVVTEKPLEIAENLIETNDLYYFSKSTKSETFVALGDDIGLFIIVDTNRKWYPTEQKAEKHYSKVKIEINERIKELILNKKASR